MKEQEASVNSITEQKAKFVYDIRALILIFS